MSGLQELESKQLQSYINFFVLISKMTDKTLRAQEAADLALLSDSDESLIENESDNDDNASWILSDSDSDENNDDDEHRMHISDEEISDSDVPSTSLVAQNTHSSRHSSKI